jgi:hypothetical protein
MWELLNTPAFAPFAIAGLVLVILLAIEMLGFLFGGMSGFLDSLLPDALADADFDADLGMDADADLSLGLKALDWLYVGRIPTMILLILFIASFCIAGYVIQQISFAILGHYLSPWLASLDALVISFPLLKVVAALIYPIIPKDESTAVTGDSLVGSSARILLGYASVGSPAQAKLTDKYGQTHYVMVEPDPDYRHPEPETTVITVATTNDTDSAKTIITAEDALVITQKIGERYLVKKV